MSCIRRELLSDRWNLSPEKDSHRLGSFNRVDEYGNPHQKLENIVYRIPGSSLLNFSFAGQPYSPETTPAVYFRKKTEVREQVIQPRDSKFFTFFQSNLSEDRPVVIPWGFGQKARDESKAGNYGGEKNPDIVEKPEPEQPEIRESYLLMNIISVVTLPDRTPIELNDLEIELDIDSFSWSLTGRLW